MGAKEGDEVSVDAPVGTIVTALSRSNAKLYI